MGNSILPSPSLALIHQPYFKQKYSILTQNQEQGMWLICSSSTRNQFILKQISTNQESQNKKYAQLAQQKIKDKNSYILQLEDYYEEKQDSYCSFQFKSYLVFEKPFKDLRTEMKERRTKRTLFEKDELMSVIETGALGLKYLKQINHPHYTISSLSMLLSKEGVILLADPWLDMHGMPDAHSYPSPEQQQFHSKSQNHQFDWMTSQLFSLGMVVLQMYHLEFMDDAYLVGKEINYSILGQKVDAIQDQELKQLVDHLLGSKRKRLLAVMQIEAYGNKLKEQTPMQIKQKQINLILYQHQPNIIVKPNQNPKDNVQKPSSQCQSSQQSKPYNYHFPKLTTTSENNFNETVEKPSSKSKNGRTTNTLTSKEKIKMKKQAENIPIQSSVVNFQGIYTPKSFQQIKSNYHHSLSRSINVNVLPHKPKNVNHQLALPVSKPYPQTKTQVQQTNESIQQDIKSNSQNFLSTQTSNQISSSFINPSQTRDNNSQGQQLSFEEIVKSPVYIIHNYDQNKPKSTESVVTSIKDEVIISKINYQMEYLIRSQSQEEKIQEEEKKDESKQWQQQQQKQKSQQTKDLIKQQDNQPEGNICFPTAVSKQTHPLHYQKNSIIVQISDSQNKSQMGERQIQQYGILYSKSQIRSQSPQSSSSQVIIEYYKQGSRYEGSKSNGMKNGYGKFVYEDGAYVEGMWKNNQLHGQGKLYYSNGKLAYDGEYDMGQFHGFGKAFNNEPISTPKNGINYKNFSGVTDEWVSYEGYIKHEQKHGKGKLIYSNGQCFEGEFVFDKMNGKGKFKRISGEIITGIWIDNLLVELI